MVKFIELHWLPGEDHEPIQMIQSVAEISRVYQTKAGNAAILLQNPLVRKEDLHFLVAESYEEVKRMLVGGEAQKVPKELRHDEARRSGNTCDGCKWNGKRHQKCSCCRRNRNMKDNYKEENNG